MSGHAGFHTKKTKGPTRKGLTATQTIILEAAAGSPSGSVIFLAGDRLGTRIVGHDEMGTPKIVAYCTPEYFLAGRGLLEIGNECHSYRITEKGRQALQTMEGE